MKVIVATIDDFVFAPYPAVVRKGKEVSPIQATILIDPPVVFNLDKPDLTSAVDQQPFWRMRKVQDKEHANMHLTTVEVVCPLPKLGKSYPKSVKVHVTVATIFKKVAPGDELVLYVPANKKVKETPKLLPVVAEPVAKKLRSE